MQKPVQLGGEDLAADDGIFADQKIGLDPCLPGGVVEHLIGVPLHPFAGVLFQTEALLALEGYIFVIAVVQLLGDKQFLSGNGLLGHLPAVGGQIVDPVLIGLYPLGVGEAGGGDLPGDGLAEVQGDGAASQQGCQPYPQSQLSFGQLGSHNQHSNLSFRGMFSLQDMPGGARI